MKILPFLLLPSLFTFGALAADNVPVAPAAASQPAPAADKAAVPAVQANTAEAEAVLKAMHYDETVNRVLDQQKHAVIGMTRQMIAKMNVPGTSPEELIAFQQKVVDTVWADIKPEEISAEVARIYGETFTKDELREIADFYNSPSGQVLVAKQPQMQQKIIGVFNARMTQVVPKMQQMTRDFVAERAEIMKAKAAAEAQKAEADKATGAAASSAKPDAVPAPAASPKP